VVVDPDRDSRRGRVLKVVGIVGTVVGAVLLIGGVIGIFSSVTGGDPFAFFWMPFVGGFLLAICIWVWTAGNLLLNSARFARGHSSPFPSTASPAVSGGWNCPKCGNRNQLAVSVCSVCGTARG
jgi:hypothetical protein